MLSWVFGAAVAPKKSIPMDPRLRGDDKQRMILSLDKTLANE